MAGAAETARGDAVRLACLILPVLALATIPVAQGTGIAAPPSNGEVSRESVRRALEELQADTALDEEVRAEAQELYRQAQAALARAAEWREQAAAHRQTTEAAPELIAQLDEELDRPAEQVEVEPPPDATLDSLEAYLAGAETDLQAARARRAEIENELVRRSERRREALAHVSAGREQVAQLEQGAPPTDAHPVVAEAWQALHAARTREARNRVEANQAFLDGYDVRGRLRDRQLLKAVREENARQQAVDQWRDNVRERRSLEAAAEVVDEDVPPVMGEAPESLREWARSIREGNAELHERRVGSDGILALTEEVSRLRQVTADTRAELRDDLAHLRETVETVGLNDSVGLMLRQQRNELPDVRGYRVRVQVWERDISDTQFEQIALRERRTALADISTAVAEQLAQARIPGDDPRYDALSQYLRGLLQQRRDILDSLIEGYDSYLGHLIDLSVESRQLIALVAEFRDYVDERVLWIRSTTTIVRDPLRVLSGLRWFADPRKWGDAVAALGRDLADSPAGWLLLLAAVAALAFRSRLVKALEQTGEQARKPSCTSYQPTLRAVGLTALIVLPVPLVLWAVGWRLSVSIHAVSPFTRQVGDSLETTAWFLLALNATRRLLRDNGLCGAHFGWSLAALRSARVRLLSLEAVVVPAVFMVRACGWQGQEPSRDALGRLALVIALLATARFAHVLLEPSRGILRNAAFQVSLELGNPARRFGDLLGVAVPLVLALLAMLGYYYTAVELSLRAFVTLCFAMALVIVTGLAVRYALLARRRWAMENARRKRAAAKESDGEAAEADDEPPDLSQLDVQTFRLLRGLAVFALVIGLWFIWSDVLPALGKLDAVEMPWTTTRTVTRTTREAGEAAGLVSEQVAVPVTLADVVLALLMGMLVLVAVGNLPALVEVGLLQRLHLASGERYAITTIMRYAIIGIGVTVVFGAIGVGWGKIQWLIAALGVGLGFGLQEIFANFVSGLIILFERPIRVGDTVTVGAVTGTVTRIKIRATTITSFDRKELIVPNKEFITGQLVNWSLSDATLRAVIEVGIAYGSDTELAFRTLHEVARANPRVLEEPPTQVVFMSFGDSALTFELRVFCSTVASYWAVRHELHMAIDKAFREAGIEIAFPQRDIHIRSIKDALPLAPADRKTGEPGDVPPVA